MIKEEKSIVFVTICFLLAGIFEIIARQVVLGLSFIAVGLLSFN